MRTFILAFSVYLILPIQIGQAAVNQFRCNAAISKNCACTVPALERSLGTDNTTLLIRAWEVTYSRDIVERDNFFARHGKALVDLAISYAQVKYFIASACGTLAFEDGPE